MPCAICGSTRRGLVTELGDVVCDGHSYFEFCHWCLRPVGTGHGFCRMCSKSTRRGRSFDDLRQRTLEWCTRTIGDHSLSTVPVFLVSEPALNSLVHGMTQWQTDGFFVQSNVSLFDGLPEVSLMSTLVHEYAHIVLFCDPLDFTFSPLGDELSNEECEGFCELMAYQFLGEEMGSEGARVQRRLLENGNLTYSDGLKMMLRRWSTTKDLPRLISDLTGRPIRRPDSSGQKSRPPVAMPVIPKDTIVKTGNTRVPIDWRDGWTREPPPKTPSPMTREPIDWRHT